MTFRIIDGKNYSFSDEDLWVLAEIETHCARFGTRLLKAGIVHARTEGFLRLEVEALATNRAMISIAEKVGFKIECMRKLE